MTAAKSGASNKRDLFMHTFRMQMAEILIADGVPLEAWQMKDLVKNYRADEFAEPVRNYIKHVLAGSPRRRGRPRKRPVPLGEFRRRIEILFDYSIVLIDFLRADKMQNAQLPRRGPRAPEETPRYRALDLIKTKYDLRASHLTIANHLSLWWRHEVAWRMVCDMLLDHAGITRRRTPMLVELNDPPSSPTSSRENES